MARVPSPRGLTKVQRPVSSNGELNSSVPVVSPPERGLKDAVIILSPSITNVAELSDPPRSPLHPENVWPLTGCAFAVTIVPFG